MGFIQEAAVTANPAQKSGVTFQNSYQVLDHYDIKYGTRSVPVYGNGNEYVSFSHWSGSYNAGVNAYNRSPYTVELEAGNQRVTIPPNGSGSVDHCTSASLYFNGRYICSSLSGTFYFNQVQVGTRTEQYEVSCTPVYRTDWNTKWSKT